MTDFNLLFFNFINSGARYYPRLDQLLLFVTSYLTTFVVMLVALYVLFWLPWHSQGLSHRLQTLRDSFEFIVALVSTWFIVQLLKVLVAIPRPFMTLHDINVLLPGQTGYSFPSGHAATTVALATIVYVKHKQLGVLLYCFAVVVSISRIYTGVHYPYDVLIGAVLGFAVSSLIHLLFIKTQKVPRGELLS